MHPPFVNPLLFDKVQNFSGRHPLTCVPFVHLQNYISQLKIFVLQFEDVHSYYGQMHTKAVHHQHP